MKFFQLILLGLQQDSELIKKKLEQAPDKSYEIGIVIGTYLPFVLFIIFAYIVYYMVRRKKD